MVHLLLVDGSNLLFQMFYGMPARITDRQGRPIQGTLGFVGALLKVIRAVRPTHVAVLFDGEHENNRTQLDPSYKANREDLSLLPEEDTPFSQLPDIYRALEHIGICYRETTDCEADDWIAGYARQYGTMHRVTVLSQDSDFFQLITDSVTVYRYRGERSVCCDRMYIWEKLGIGPERYAAFKALVGDTADNIRGVPGVGPKTAAVLLEQFTDLEEMLENIQAVKKPSVRAALEENAQRLRINYRLIRLDGAGELPFSLEDMTYADRGLTTRQVLRAIGL